MPINTNLTTKPMCHELQRFGNSHITMFIDHFVWVTSDLRLEMEHFQEITGVRPDFGGSHPGKGTHNALVRVGQTCYLEIIAPDPFQHQVDRPWMIPEQLAHHGLIKWAWTSTDIEGDSRRMDELGCPVGPISAGKRLRDDGNWLHWQLTDPDYNESPLVPFLICWNQDRHPVSSLPLQCQLRSVRLFHPRPEGLQFIELVSDSIVTMAAGRELLSLEIEIPKGVLVLSTQAPHCQVR